MTHARMLPAAAFNPSSTTFQLTGEIACITDGECSDVGLVLYS